MAAFRHEEADRVPIGELGIDPKVIAGFGRGYADAADFALGEGLDLVSAFAYFDRIKTKSDGSWIDEWGCTYKPSCELVSHPVAGPITIQTDLSEFDFPDPNATRRLGELPQLVNKRKGRVAVNFHARVAFMWSVYLMGMDNLLMTMASAPDFAASLFSRVADVNIQMIRNAIRVGADTVSLGDDYCSNRGPLMSPSMFRELLLPHLQKAVDAIHEEGAKCIKHCDGYTWPILEDMINTGVDCINPIEPASGMDLAEVKKTCGARAAIMGNIDCGELLSHGSEKDVEAAVTNCMNEAGHGGELIISSSNSIHSGVRPENYAAMIGTVHTRGEYPLPKK